MGKYIPLAARVWAWREIVFFCLGGAAKLRWREGAQRPVWSVNEPKKTGARSARARTHGQNPLVVKMFKIWLRIRGDIRNRKTIPRYQPSSESLATRESGYRTCGDSPCECFLENSAGESPTPRNFNTGSWRKKICDREIIHWFLKDSPFPLKRQFFLRFEEKSNLRQSWRVPASLITGIIFSYNYFREFETKIENVLAIVWGTYVETTVLSQNGRFRLAFMSLQFTVNSNEFDVGGISRKKRQRNVKMKRMPTESPRERRRDEWKVGNKNHIQHRWWKTTIFILCRIVVSNTKTSKTTTFGISCIIDSLSICRLIIPERTDIFTDIVQIVFMPTGRNWTRS